MQKETLNNRLLYRQFGVPEEVLLVDQTQMIPLEAGSVRVKMQYAPVNASDLIPITGAYRHRINPPQVAGYEGMGTVIEASPMHQHLLGTRVLPLRADGTWQQYVDCNASLVIPVPDDVDSMLAARAYINPVAAKMMLELYKPIGLKVLLTAAGSDCASLLGQWALRDGAVQVAGIIRSPVHAHELVTKGIIPVNQDDSEQIKALAAQADLVFDATGGSMADLILGAMKKTASFVCYGLLSGQLFTMTKDHPAVHWFHIRNYLGEMSTELWQSLFAQIWSLLRVSKMSPVKTYPFQFWQNAVCDYRTAGRSYKPLIVMNE